MQEGVLYDQPQIWGVQPEPYQVQVRADILDILPDDVTSVLDVGCGDGFVTNALPEHLRVVGMDISATAIGHLRHKASLGSITAMPFADDSFDLVMVNDVVEHLTEPQYRQARDELMRVARKYILITVPHGEQLESHLTRCAGCGGVYHVNWHQRSFTAETMRELMEEPFRLVELRLSGDETRPPWDPTVDLRHELKLYHQWSGAVCPHCGSKEQIGDGGDTFVGRSLDVLRSLRWAWRPGESGPWNCRTEIMGLYACGNVRRRPRHPLDVLPQVGVLTVDFRNVLQKRESDFVPGSMWARFTLPAGAVQDGRGVRRGEDAPEPMVVQVRLPIQCRQGDRISVRFSGRSEADAVSLYSLDGLSSAQTLLDGWSCNARRDKRSEKVTIQEPWWPDRFGTAVEVCLSGEAAVEELRYEPAQYGEPSVPFVVLRPGHNCMEREQGDLLLSWGYLTESGGIRPHPDFRTVPEMPSLWQHKTKPLGLLAMIEQASSRLAAEVRRLSEQCEQREQLRESAERAACDLESRRRELEKRIEQLYGQLDEKEAERDRVEHEYSRLESEYAALGRTLEELNEKLCERERLRDAAERTAYATEQRLADTLKILDEKEASLADLEKRLADSVGSVAALRSEHERLEGLGRKWELADLLRLREDLRERLVKLGLGEAKSWSQLLEEFAGWKERFESKEVQRDAAERAYSALQEEYRQVCSELALRTGLRGGAREVMRSARRKFVGQGYPTPQPVFPPPWKPVAKLPEVRPGQLKVLALSHMFPHPDQLSSGPFILEQVAALRRHGDVDVRVLVGRPFWMMNRNPVRLIKANRCYKRFHDACGWYEIDGVLVRYVPYRVFWRFMTHGWSYRSAMCRDIEQLRAEFPFDIVHAHTAYTDGSAGREIARRYNVPLVITEHTGPFTILTRNPVVKRWTLRSLKSAARVIAVSNAQSRSVARHLPSKYHGKFTVLPNVVDTELFHPPAKWSPDPRAPRIIFVGFFVAIKRLPMLLAAFEQVHRRLPGARLRLVGGGETPEQESVLRESIDRMNLDGSVEILGYQSREEIARILREESDILVLASEAETFGCVLTEAMACGKPVVSTRCGGPEDIITDPSLGELAANGSADDLARSILDVAARLPSYSPERIRAHVEDHFSSPAVARRIVDIYKQARGEA